MTAHGLCRCGCGQRTKLRTRSGGGRKVGEPRDYVGGHQARSSPLEYVEEDRGYDTPCWIWQRQTSDHGYGRTTHNGRQQQAHRAYYEREFGPIPDGLEPDHLCRIRACVNPAHLEPVTRAENARRGAKTILTAEQVRAIHGMAGRPQSAVADEFGVSESCIAQIRRGERWADLAPMKGAA